MNTVGIKLFVKVLGSKVDTAEERISHFKYKSGLVWWLVSVIPALRLRQQDLELEDRLGYETLS
jgi:hypothetical protein